MAAAGRRSRIDPAGESSEVDPEPGSSEVDPEPGSSGVDPEPGSSGVDPEPGSSEVDPAGKRAEVLVSVEGGHLERLSAVAEELRSAGMEVGAVMDELGVVSGSVEPEKMERLAAVSGVATVEAARDVRIPPPDSPVQ